MFKPDDPALTGDCAGTRAGIAGARSGAGLAGRTASVHGAALDIDRASNGARSSPRRCRPRRLFALSVWFYRLVSVAIWQDDWVGWTLRILVGVAAFALIDDPAARADRLRAARPPRPPQGRHRQSRRRARHQAGPGRSLRQLLSLYGGRPELRWAAQRLREHARDVHDPGALLTLADRELMPEVDGAARRIITASARRVAMVTSFSPFATLAFGFVAVENIRMLRKLAEIYGGRPGFAGSLSLTRRVIVHLLATGSLALTDDLIGQFIGQGVVQRLSRRLGEGAFNGALTARVGVAAIDVLRPLPYLAARPVRSRDIVAEALADLWGSAKKG